MDRPPMNHLKMIKNTQTVFLQGAQLTLALGFTWAPYHVVCQPKPSCHLFVLAPLFCVMLCLSVHVYIRLCFLLSITFWSCSSLDKKDLKTFGMIMNRCLRLVLLKCVAQLAFVLRMLSVN